MYENLKLKSEMFRKLNKLIRIFMVNNFYDLLKVFDTQLIGFVFKFITIAESGMVIEWGGDSSITKYVVK